MSSFSASSICRGDCITAVAVTVCVVFLALVILCVTIALCLCRFRDKGTVFACRKWRTVRLIIPYSRFFSRGVYFANELT